MPFRGGTNGICLPRTKQNGVSVRVRSGSQTVLPWSLPLSAESGAGPAWHQKVHQPGEQRVTSPSQKHALLLFIQACLSIVRMHINEFFKKRVLKSILGRKVIFARSFS